MPPHSSSADPTGNLAVPSGEVRAQVERILTHSLLLASPRLSTLLRYTVEMALAGQASDLKEYNIGAEAFDRGASFDPRTDNVVRVSANRLRTKLLEYYQRAGQSDPVVIDLPKGGYVPLFSYSRTAETAAQSASRRSVPRRLLAGRRQELDRMRAAFESVRTPGGPGSMLSISGDAGLGKTTLAEEFLAELESLDIPPWVARGRCSERLTKTDALAPILECLDELTRGKSGPEPALLMKREAPGWFTLFAPGTEDPRQTNRTSQERMRREFVRFFEALSLIRPVVMFLDDLHWADESTCDLLEYLIPRLRDTRILILATYRPAGLFSTHPFVPVRTALERRDACVDVPLGHLSRADLEDYLNRRFPLNSFPAEFIEVVRERTEGNPLFLRELLSFLIDGKILAEQQGRWVLNREVPAIRKLMPIGAHAIIRLQVGRFEDRDRRLLECAAVQGVEFDSAVISRVLNMDPVVVEEQFQALERVHRFVRSVDERQLPDRTLSTRYRFVHVLFQNALYADLPPTRRATLSLAVADAMTGLPAESGAARAAGIALLFEAGRDPRRAAEYFQRAARHSASVFAYPEAVTLCESGLRCLLSLPESNERDARELQFSLMLGISQMAVRGYAAPEVEITHRRSWALCLKLNEKRRLVRVMWGVHTCHVNSGELAAALTLAREMRQLADASGDPASIAESLHALGTTLAFMGDFVAARKALEAIFPILPVGGHKMAEAVYVLDPCVTSLSMLAMVLARLCLFDEALERANAAVALANELAHPPSLAYASFWTGWTRHARGEHTEACQQLDAAMALSSAQGLPQIYEWGRVVRGSSLAHLGRPAEGIAEIRTSLDNQRAMRCLLERPYCLTLLAEALMKTGCCHEALALCDEAIDTASRTQGRSFDVQTKRLRLRILDAILGRAEADQGSPHGASGGGPVGAPARERPE